MDTTVENPTDSDTEGFGTSVRKAVETYSASIDTILTKARLATQMLDAKPVQGTM
jgi:hypothetical protein